MRVGPWARGPGPRAQWPGTQGPGLDAWGPDMCPFGEQCATAQDMFVDKCTFFDECMNMYYYISRGGVPLPSNAVALRPTTATTHPPIPAYSVIIKHDLQDPNPLLLLPVGAPRRNRDGRLHSSSARRSRTTRMMWRKSMRWSRIVSDLRGSSLPMLPPTTAPTTCVRWWLPALASQVGTPQPASFCTSSVFPNDQTLTQIK